MASIRPAERRVPLGALLCFGGVVALTVTLLERHGSPVPEDPLAAVHAEGERVRDALARTLPELAGSTPEEAERILAHRLDALDLTALALEDEKGRPVAHTRRDDATDLSSGDRLSLVVTSDGPPARRLVATLDAARLRAPLRPARSAAAPWIGVLLLAGGLGLLVRRRRPDVPGPPPVRASGGGDDDPTSEDLAEAYAKLQEIDRQKDAFLSSVSHEFRTPLSSIRSFSEILLNYENEDPTTMREFLSIIHEESERLSRLVNDLLDLTKIESGSAEWRMTRVELGPLVETVLRSASSLARQNGVELFAHVRDELPTVEADRDRLHQVLTNLVSNALKFSPEQGRIDVRVGVDDGQLRIDVEDEGPGVPEEDRERIFEKFHQARQPDGDAPRGTGLGLPISREIVQHHGGLLWVEPRATGGSRFSFTLPVPARVS